MGYRAGLFHKVSAQIIIGIKIVMTYPGIFFIRRLGITTNKAMSSQLADCGSCNCYLNMMR